MYVIEDATVDDASALITRLARAAVEAADHVGLTLRAAVAPVADPVGAELDEVQRRAGRGPCVDAAEHGRPVHLAALVGIERYPEFAEVAARRGIASTFSAPLAVTGRRLGAINLYSRRREAFAHLDLPSPDAFGTTALGEFAAQAAALLANVDAHARLVELSQQLAEALTTRTTIAQAQGIIMGALRCTPDDAFRRLVDQSQRTNTKLRDVAAAIVADATRGG